VVREQACSQGIGASACAPGTIGSVAVLRLFASAREAAGTGSDVVDGTTVGEVLDRAAARYGEGFAAVLATCKIWLNGSAAQPTDPVGAGDEVAVLPPVSGGSQ
jgi:molybdopterin converting factor small subunit